MGDAGDVAMRLSRLFRSMSHTDRGRAWRVGIGLSKHASLEWARFRFALAVGPTL